MKKEDLLQLQRKISSLRVEGKYKETIEACHRLLKYGTELSDHKSILIAHIHNAVSYYSIGAMEESFNSIDAYQEVCSRYGDKDDTLNLYNVLFLLYEYNKKYDKAKETLEKTIELGLEIEKYNIVSNGYSNYSHIYLAEKKFEDALEMAEKGIEMAKLHTPSYPILDFRVKLNMVQSYIGLKDFGTSKAMIEEMIHDPLLDSFIREKAQCHMLHGNWFAEQNLYEEAFQSLSTAKELVESYKDLVLLKTIQEKRINLCEEMNDIETAFIVQKEYIALLKEMSDQEIAVKALQLDIKHSIAEIQKRATTDFLTGVYNRDFLETTANVMLKEAARTKESVICILFDIDDFKSINDQYGHLFGDEAIKQVSQACSTIIEENELFGRYGGDEFVVILQNQTIENAIKKAEQIKEVVGNCGLNKDGKSIALTLSIGISSNLEGTVGSFSELFHIADTGLYKAKGNGKQQIFVGR